MSTETDPEDDNPTPQALTFRGKELRPYSFMYRSAFYRITGVGILPNLERYVYLVYLLSKTPVEVDAIRTETDIARFRAEAGEWADREQLIEEAGWPEVEALAKSILDPVAKAEAIVPDVKPGRRKPGNG